MWLLAVFHSKFLFKRTFHTRFNEGNKRDFFFKCDGDFLFHVFKMDIHFTQ